MLTIACVLKTGGDYTLEDVIRLRNGVGQHIPAPYRFVCLTNHNNGWPNGTPKFMNNGIQTEPLKHDWPGWWSKIEVFRLVPPVLYLDLDTIIVGWLAEICREIVALENRFLVLRDFYYERNNRPVASGVMGWANDMSWLTELFSKLADEGINFDGGNRMMVKSSARRYRGDQDWLAETLAQYDTPLVYLQDIVPGIYSYKVHLEHRDLPADAKIVCFHGRPRPKNVNPKPEWLSEYDVALEALV